MQDPAEGPYLNCYSLLTVQPKHVLRTDCFSKDVHTGRLFLFACPPQYTSFIYVHIGPPHAGK